MTNALAVLPVELDLNLQIESPVLSSLQAVTKVLRGPIALFAELLEHALPWFSSERLLNRGAECSDFAWTQTRSRKRGISLISDRVREMALECSSPSTT